MTVLKIHKAWADRFLIFSIILVVGLMVAAAAIAEMAEADGATRRA